MVSPLGDVIDVHSVASTGSRGDRAVPATLTRMAACGSLELAEQVLLSACLEVARADCGYIAGFSAEPAQRPVLALWTAQPSLAHASTPQLCDSTHAREVQGTCPCSSALVLGRACASLLQADGVRACETLSQATASMLELVSIPLWGDGGRVCGVLGLGFRALHVHEGPEQLERQLGPLLALCALGVRRREQQPAPGVPRPSASRPSTEKAQRLSSLGVLAGGIAHDFNNLLLAIMGNIGLSRLDLPPEHAAQHSLQEAEAAALRAAGLCRRLLAYAGHGRFMLEPVLLSELIEDMLERLSAQLGKHIALRLRLSPRVPPVQAAAGQLRDVIASLIENAAEAVGDAPGLISVRTDVRLCDRAYLSSAYLDDDLPAGRYVVLEVSDTGCGMDAETSERAFEPFFSTKFAGRGLGLSSVLGVVRGHRGAIRIRSEERRGTLVEVLLPALPEHAAEVAGAPQPMAASRPGTVLVIDDEANVREVAQRMLELAGFRVLLAESGRDALAVYREQGQTIDVVLLDMTMPELDGRETYRELAAIRPDVRVVLTSGYSEQEAFSEWGGEGLAGFLQKPYRPADLVATLLRAQAAR